MSTKTANLTLPPLHKYKRAIPWLEFEPIEHKYYVDGQAVLSVTTILGLAKISKRYYGSASNAAWRGTTCHTCCEYDDDGTLDETTVDKRLHGYLAGWRKFKSENAFEPVLIEQILGCRNRMIAGTVDRLGIVKGKLTLIDVKTGRVHPWHEIQMAGYLSMIDHCREWLDIPPGPIDCLAVYLTHDGEYQLGPVKDPDGLIPVFDGALKIAGWWLTKDEQA